MNYASQIHWYNGEITTLNEAIDAHHQRYRVMREQMAQHKSRLKHLQSLHSKRIGIYSALFSKLWAQYQFIQSGGLL